jgi:hypothetical protein
LVGYFVISVLTNPLLPHALHSFRRPSSIVRFYHRCRPCRLVCGCVSVPLAWYKEVAACLCRLVRGVVALSLLHDSNFHTKSC